MGRRVSAEDTAPTVPAVARQDLCILLQASCSLLLCAGHHGQEGLQNTFCSHLAVSNANANILPVLPC